MCETRRSDKAPSEREDASSTAVQPGSPCDAHGMIQLQTPPTRRRPRRGQDPLTLGSQWLPDLKIDPELPLTPTSGLKRSLEHIIADDSPVEPDKLASMLNYMLEEEVKISKRQKLEIRTPKQKNKKAAQTAVQADSGDRHGTTHQQPPAGREMNGPHTRQARNP